MSFRKFFYNFFFEKILCEGTSPLEKSLRIENTGIPRQASAESIHLSGRLLLTGYHPFDPFQLLGGKTFLFSLDKCAQGLNIIKVD